MWSAHATRRPVAYTGLHARQPRRAVVLHTNGGGTDHGSLFGWWSQVAAKGQHIGAHFQVTVTGHAEQYVDTGYVIYHAYSASEWAVGIETEDDGHPATPWTSEQLATIIALCHELQVPGRLLMDSPSDGIGWHEQYRDWNQSGHTCPGAVREQQIRDVILPALRQPTPPAPHPTPVPGWYHRVLRVQKPYLTGGDVGTVQAKLRVTPHDGIYGPRTAAAVDAFQHAHHLATDGVVGPDTARALGA